MKRMSLAVTVGLVAGLMGLSAQTAPVAKTDRALNDRTLTVTGCVAEGIEAGSYTLKSATFSPPLRRGRRRLERRGPSVPRRARQWSTAPGIN